MKSNWHGNNIMKGFLIVVSYLLVGFMAVYAVMAVNVSHGDDIIDRPREYSESAKFQSALNNAVSLVTESIAAEDFFSVDGEFDPDRLVDIEFYARHFRISDVNQSGVAYRLEDLLNWSEVFRHRYDHWDMEFETVIVAMKPDGTFSYYDIGEFNFILNTLERQGNRQSNFSIVTELGADGNIITIVLDGQGNAVSIVNLEDFTKEMQREMRWHEGDEFWNWDEMEENWHWDDFHQYDDIIDENGNAVEEVDRLGLQEFPNVVFDQDWNILYINWWHLDIIAQHFPPAGADSLLELVNNNPNLNGRLSEISIMLETVLWDLAWRTPMDMRWQYTEGNSNFIYFFVDEANERVITNRSEFEDYENVAASVASIVSNENIKYFRIGTTRLDFETNIEGLREYNILMSMPIGTGFFIGAVDMSFPVHDEFYFNSQFFYGSFIPFVGTFFPLFISSILALLIVVVWLTVVSGRKVRGGEVELIGFDKWKTELSAILIFGSWILFIMMVGDIGWRHMGRFFEYVALGFIIFITWTMFLFGYLSLVRRVKAKTLWNNSILKVFIELTKMVLTNISITWKAIGFTIGVILVNWFCILINQPFFVILMLLFNAVVIYYIAIMAIGKNRIIKGIEEIASGDIDYQISLDKMRGVNLETAKLVNRIGDGLHHAVEKGMRSERMKADLITNVSHDIKTPLTSIINYIDLLKREKFKDPKVQGYLDVLEAKAEQLKTLTEDVVEASKVSSGNVTLEKMDINLTEMLNQVEGEFKERFGNKNLTMVSNISDDSMTIYVDGKRMWRILDNIYTNIYKYAMPGTRVYLDATKDESRVAFSVKNISEQPLNISPDELTERFIRGDTARTTEGSGLGLSIAKSLTELQGGSFEIFLDGDLFKVVIGFPLVKK